MIEGWNWKLKKLQQYQKKKKEYWNEKQNLWETAIE